MPIVRRHKRRASEKKTIYELSYLNEKGKVIKIDFGAEKYAEKHAQTLFKRGLYAGIKPKQISKKEFDRRFPY